jgi:hypothetical protein
MLQCNARDMVIMRTDVIHAGGSYQQENIPHLRGHMPYDPSAKQRIVVVDRTANDQVVPFNSSYFTQEQHGHFQRLILM